jgi:UDP-N-acetylglucosamine acyltransferase
MGKNNRVFHGAMLGCEPQDLSFNSDQSKPLLIGNGNLFKEGVNVSRGVKTETGTQIGNNNYFMGNFHVGHDCVIGDSNILGHGTVLAGHVNIGDHVFISGVAAIHQFSNIGDRAMIAGCAKVVKDIPPYTIGDGNPARVSGLNSVGLRRAGFPPAVRDSIKLAYKRIYTSGDNIGLAIRKLSLDTHCEEVGKIILFYQQSSRGVTAHRRDML